MAQHSVPPASEGSATTRWSRAATRARRLSERLRSRRQSLVAAVAVVATVLVMLLGALLGRMVWDPGSPGAAAGTTPSPSAASETASPTVTDVYDHAALSVVTITTDRDRLGSGVVADADGDILTAAHVVTGARTIDVTFADGTKTTATVASSSAATDIATLAPVDLPETLVPATIGGKAAEVGASVIAVGNPLGLSSSLTTGVVSGLDRSPTTADGTSTGLIQFDAAVNRGSSGGPLLDAQGSVIGIVVSIADPGGDDAFAGIAFAVPIGDALGGGGGPGEPGAGGTAGPQI